MENTRINLQQAIPHPLPGSTAWLPSGQENVVNRRIKILMVEDERLIAAHTEQVLREAGFHYIAHATSGEMAIQIAETFRPDLLLMDFSLKGKLNGLQTVAEIRRQQMLPVIFITASFKKIQEKPENCYFLSKPLGEHLLLTLVAELSHQFK